ncbi:MAG: UDP-N-acetylglucosamine pyrophosphorylase [Ruminococcaceae bacterium]|nr:UDP-N-acetylglucosamine pyrophosphorylase [Oscillospiraceae bacterium]
MIKTAELIDLSHTLAGRYLSMYEYPWQALSHIKDIIMKIGEGLPSDEFYCPEKNVWIANDAKVAPTAFIGAPSIIGHGTEVRHCAFIRGSALVGDGAVIGNSVELKNCIISDGAQVPHYNYVGDSILGYRSHMGAGAVTSNVKSDKTPVTVKIGDERIKTGLKKFGAILGDLAEIGCGAVLNPGTVIGRRTSVYPQVSVRGYIPDGCIVKSEINIVKRRA